MLNKLPSADATENTDNRFVVVLARASNHDLSWKRRLLNAFYYVASVRGNQSHLCFWREQFGRRRLLFSGNHRLLPLFYVMVDEGKRHEVTTISAYFYSGYQLLDRSTTRSRSFHIFVHAQTYVGSRPICYTSQLSTYDNNEKLNKIVFSEQNYVKLAENYPHVAGFAFRIDSMT